MFKHPFSIMCLLHSTTADVNQSVQCVSHAPSPGQVSLQSCSECGERILEGGLLISGQFYHEACFTCTSCGAVLSGTYYTQEVATCPLA